MKLPKALLTAMLVGITLQTVQSCTKKTDPPTKEEKEKEEEENKPKPITPYNCPACGMG
jgi:anaerobic selenocysteine-containing dehydrogenase